MRGRVSVADDDAGRLQEFENHHLPNNLSMEKILAGNSNIRNPILVSYVAKGLLPYHGLGSCIEGMQTHNGTTPELIEDEELFLVRLWNR